MTGAAPSNTVAQALIDLASAKSINDVEAIARTLSSTASGTKGAVLYSGQIGGYKSELIALKLADSNGLDILNNTDRAKFLVNVAVKQKLFKIYRSAYPDATAVKIQYLVTNKLFGGNSGSLWGEASTEFVSSVKGAVEVITQNPNPNSVFSAVEASAVAENMGITSINDVMLTTARRQTAGSIISLSRSTFTSALSRGGVFATSASAANAEGVAVAEETLAKIGALTVGAKTAAALSAEGLVNLTSGVLETAAAIGTESILAGAGSRVLGLLGKAIAIGGEVAGSAFATFLVGMWPSKTAAPELDTLAKETDASLSEDTPSVVAGHVYTYANGVSAVNVPLSNASGTLHDQYVFAENPAAETAVLALTTANDSKLVISSVNDAPSTVDQQITDATANGEYRDQIKLSLSSTGGINVGITIMAGGGAEVQSYASLPQVADTFTFSGPKGTLTIDNSSDFTGTIADFAPGDIIDLAGIGTTTGAKLSDKNVLEVQASGGSAALQLSANPDNFIFSDDGNGGTNIRALAYDQNADLSAGNSVLLIRSPATFRGTISNFGPGDTIDISDFDPSWQYITISNFTYGSTVAGDLLSWQAAPYQFAFPNENRLLSSQSYAGAAVLATPDGDGGESLTIQYYSFQTVTGNLPTTASNKFGDSIQTITNTGLGADFGVINHRNGSVTTIMYPGTELDDAKTVLVGINNAGQLFGTYNEDFGLTEFVATPVVASR